MTTREPGQRARAGARAAVTANVPSVFVAKPRSRPAPEACPSLPSEGGGAVKLRWLTMTPTAEQE